MNALKSHKSLYDLVVVDSKGIEMDFANQLESRNEVAVYTKLPNGFYINTPVGHYNPDWAVVFHEGSDIKHIYFVAETKGYDKDSLKDYRRAESVKIECASRHFAISQITTSHMIWFVSLLFLIQPSEFFIISYFVIYILFHAKSHDFCV